MLRYVLIPKNMEWTLSEQSVPAITTTLSSEQARSLLIPNWPAPATVCAVSSTRLGGASQAPFASFNLGDHVGDAAITVAQNRQTFQTLAKMPAAPVWLQQVHGTAVVKLDDNLSASAVPIADAAYSQQLGKVCVVMTADCLPLLICDKAGTQVAAVHAGWRGLAAGVIEQTLQHFKAKPADLMVWLGPAIGAQAFEVGAEVRTAFVAQHAAATAAFHVCTPGKYLADIYLLARIRLAQYGISAIYGGEYCTYQQTEQFFSYRRDGQTGRMASAIWLNSSR